MQKFRIFLASPGDVSTERRIAREVIEQIRNELRFRDHLDIKVVTWDQELSEVLDQYLRHVSAFIAIRDAGEDWKFPDLLGYPWPEKLIPMIEGRLEDLRKERKRLEYQAG